VNPTWTLRTARTVLRPVAWADLPDLTALKSDARVYAVMLGGVRTPARVAEEMAADLSLWGARGVGMWTVRDAGDAAFLGIAGLHERPDGRGLALRFAFRPEARGRGLAREAAGAALRFAHDRAGIIRVIAVARQANFASRTVLGAIGMRECTAFVQAGHPMLEYESVDPGAGAGRGG
jgi:RimJ/RimL family protein N-acetyltransferase